MTKENKKNIQLTWPYKRKNYVLFGVGVFVIIVGYLIMYTGDVNSFQSLTLAPITLFIGYIILIPSALIYKKRIIKKD